MMQHYKVDYQVIYRVGQKVGHRLMTIICS